MPSENRAKAADKAAYRNQRISAAGVSSRTA
jgi:hypothetical protein